MKALKYLPAVLLAAALVGLCVFGIVLISPDKSSDLTSDPAATAMILSSPTIDGETDDTYEEISDAVAEQFSDDEPEEDSMATWATVLIDIAVIVATIGLLVLVWLYYKKFVKRNGGSTRRFG